MKPLLDKSQHSFARRIALGTAACAIALTAAACSSGSEVASFQRENDLFRGGDPMAMIGLRPRKRERIDYNPRSPLVMPPAPELQTPKEKTELGAAWPQDPDELAAKEEEAREEYLREKASKEDRSRAMKPNELNDWARQAGMRSSNPNERPAGNEVSSVRILSPATLLGRRKAPQDPNVEPERRKLTQPPEGYRKPVTDENGEVHTTADDEKPKRRGFFSRLGF
ncbi:MAG: hypothetical protein R3D43_08440 [Tepidamorphaceae bacterium]|nr:hypothetical protein [Rhodobiaceae bacterium]MCC0049013.1 hypothetical protein [Rhodobiaceae bacterium]